MPDPLPLAGIRVLDLSRIIAGPYCSMVLGDMGADVIKVEQPGVGDDSRTWGPPFVEGESAYFFCLNRNKRSVTLDFKASRGKEVLKALAVKSDILLENFRPGTLDRLGLGYDVLGEVNRRLIYCAVSGFGNTGPGRDRAGYDVIVQAVGGLMSFTGEEGGGPVKVGVALTDITTALHAHGAILAALWERERTGRGRRIDLSLLETQVATLINIGSSFLNGAELPRRWGTAHVNIVPYQAFRTKDGMMIIGAGNDRLWEKLCEVLGMAEVGRDPRFATNEKRVAHRAEIVRMIEDRLAARTTREWDEAIGKAGIPCGPINDLEQVFADAQVRHLGMVETVHHPKAGPIRIVRSPVSLDGSPLPMRLPPPTLGQHTDEVLRQLLGFSEEEVSALREQGVV